METVHYCVEGNSNIFSCLFDASKAFDKVHYGKLFDILIKRKLSYLITRLSLDSYTNNMVNVHWDSSTSQYFDDDNGVKQGGAFSPILFTVHIDGLTLLMICSQSAVNLQKNFM